MTVRDDILTISDVSNLLKVSEKTLYGLAQKGDLPGFKVGGQWRFQRAAINSWIQGWWPVAVSTSGNQFLDPQADSSQPTSDRAASARSSRED